MAPQNNDSRRYKENGFTLDRQVSQKGNLAVTRVME